MIPLLVPVHAWMSPIRRFHPLTTHRICSHVSGFQEDEKGSRRRINRTLMLRRIKGLSVEEEELDYENVEQEKEKPMGRPFRRTIPSSLTTSKQKQQQQQQQQENKPNANLPWKARTHGWRPTPSDVMNISWGKPARQKGTGSRGVPHRLNHSEERFLFDQARRKGFVQVIGSGWRSTRRDSPLLNTWRNWNDARGRVSIVLHKGRDDVQGDHVLVDVSPLRLPEILHRVCQDTIAYIQEEMQIVGVTTNTIWRTSMEDSIPFHDTEKDRMEQEEISTELIHDSIHPPVTTDVWETVPIYQLPTVTVEWNGLPRSQAKELCKLLSNVFDTMDTSASSGSPSKSPIHVKPGKNRRSGGYGIG